MTVIIKIFWYTVMHLFVILSLNSIRVGIKFLLDVQLVVIAANCIAKYLFIEPNELDCLLLQVT